MKTTGMMLPRRHDDITKRFMETFHKVRKEQSDNLSELWENAIEKAGDGDPSKHLLLLRFLPGEQEPGEDYLLKAPASLRNIAFEGALDALLAALPHVEPDGRGPLDCILVGDEYYSQSRFVCGRDGRYDDYRVKPDGSPESAWEVVLFKWASEQFYLGWHAYYDATYPVWDADDFFREARKRFPDECRCLRRRLGRAACARMREIDYAPCIRIADGKASVTYFVFSPFAGLLRICDTVDLATGAIVSGRASAEVVIPYECGIMY